MLFLKISFIMDCNFDTLIFFPMYSWGKKCYLTLFRLSYVYIHTKSQNRYHSYTYIYTYTYTDFAIEKWGFNRHLIDTLRYHQHKVFTCFRLTAYVSMFTRRKECGVYSKFFVVFRELWKLRLPDQVQIHRLAWKTTTNCMDFLLWKWS